MYKYLLIAVVLLASLACRAQRKPDKHALMTPINNEWEIEYNVTILENDWNLLITSKDTIYIKFADKEVAKAYPNRTGGTTLIISDNAKFKNFEKLAAFRKNHLLDKLKIAQ